MGIYYILIAALGACAGGFGVWLKLNARLVAITGDRDRLEQQRHQALTKVSRLSNEANDIFDASARALSQIVGDAENTLQKRVVADDALDSGFAELLKRRPGDPDTSLVEAAEKATEMMAQRERDLAAELSELERTSDMVAQTLDAAMADDRMSEHKVDDLVVATGEAVGAASAMDDVIRRLQSSAAETAELSTQVSTEAERGYRAVHRTLDEIERIRELTGAARTRIGSLGDRVADIGNVVRVIQDITQKTNLLALNASIIAAQAGEHGRSFSVVAQEIKALAQRTAASTKEISEQIRGVQDESERATAAMGDGVAAVGEGFQVAIAAGDALDAIRQSARAAQKRVQSMTRNLRQQNAVAQQVVDSASAVSDRAASFAKAVRGQSSMTERLRTTAMDIQVGAQRIAEQMREHGATSHHCTETLNDVVVQMTDLSVLERDLSRRVDALRSSAQGGRSLSDDLAAQWSSISAAAAQLRSDLERLQGA